MTFEREDMRMAYGNFIEGLEMTTEKILRSNFKIYRPCKQFGERLSSDKLAETSLPLNQRVGFITWCDKYTKNVFDEFQKLSVFVKIVERDDYWEVFVPIKIAEVKQSEIFNTIAHFCGSPMWKGIDFGELDSPLKFDDFIKNFEQDGWEALHSQLERYSLRIWEDVYNKIDDVVEVCKRLDLLGKSEQTWYDCKNRVFGK